MIRVIEHMNGTKTIQYFHPNILGFSEDGVPHYGNGGTWIDADVLRYGDWEYDKSGKIVDLRERKDGGDE